MSWKWHSQRAASLGVRPVQLDKHSATRQKHRVWWPDENAVALLIDADHMPAQSIGLFQSLAERLVKRQLVLLALRISIVDFSK